MLTVKRAAQLAGVSPSLVYAWCRAGVLKHSRFGRAGKRGCVRIAEADLDAFLAGCRRDGRPPPAGPLPLRHITA
jgi:excisionase family DNA binding protein